MKDGVVRLTAAEEVDLAARIKLGDEAARERLITCNIPLVAKLASRYWCEGMTRDDLIQEGMFGLIHAVGRFDPVAHEVRFSTYAARPIRRSIQKCISTMGSLIRVPEKTWRLQIRLWMLMGESDGEPLGSKELAEALGVTESCLSLATGAVFRRVPAGDSLDGSPGGVAIEDIESRLPAPDEVASRREQRAALKVLLRGIPRDEARVLRMRHGIWSGEAMTLEAVASLMGTSKTRVHTLERSGISRLRRMMAA
jgi:RNA polymerase sigma factor (sigma-70 family)